MYNVVGFILVQENTLKKLNILALEPYYGGSHKAFLDTWIAHSRHDWTLFTANARHWKWRMRGSAMWFAEQLAEKPPAGRFDAIFTCDMTSIADLKGMLPPRLRYLPILCYFHENQLTYPLSPDDTPDYQYGFTNITSAISADAVWFNSESHRRAFLEATADLLREMPDFLPVNLVSNLKEKATVQYPAVEPASISTEPQTIDSDKPLRILWSHRWEYDKNPEEFFEVMLRLLDANANFELVLVGEQFRVIPDTFKEGYKRLKTRVPHAGFLETKEAYWEMLNSCDVIVSTAIQENFGISVVEAILAGCFPLLPDRLSYPELIPESCHKHHLFRNKNDLYKKLTYLCTPKGRQQLNHHQSVRESIEQRFAANNQVQRLDEALEESIKQVNHAPGIKGQ